MIRTMALALAAGSIAALTMFSLLPDDAGAARRWYLRSSESLIPDGYRQWEFIAAAEEGEPLE